MADLENTTTIPESNEKKTTRSYTRKNSALKKTPCIVLSVKSVPNYQIMYNELADRKYWETLASGNNSTKTILDEDDLKEYESELRVNGFLPIAYQKIVGVSVIATDINGETTFASFTGDENFVLEKTWAKISEYMPSKEAPAPYPVIITNDRKKASLPLLISRSTALFKSLQTSLCKAGYGSIHDVASDSKLKDSKLGKLCAQFDVIKNSLSQILCKSDKWESRRPNYTNPYSNYQPDMAYDYYISGDDLYSTQLADEMVGSNSWDALAYFSIAKLLDVYKSYLTGQQIVNNTPCMKEIFKITNKDVKRLMSHDHLAPRYNPSIPSEVVAYCRQLREVAKKLPQPEDKKEEQVEVIEAEVQEKEPVLQGTYDISR